MYVIGMYDKSRTYVPSFELLCVRVSYLIAQVNEPAWTKFADLVEAKVYSRVRAEA